MKTLQRTNLNEIPDGLKYQILERFGHALDMYRIPFDYTDSFCQYAIIPLQQN